MRALPTNRENELETAVLAFLRELAESYGDATETARLDAERCASEVAA